MATEIVSIQKLTDGTEIKMCKFDNGTYNYCSEIDYQNAVIAANVPNLVKVSKVNQNAQRAYNINTNLNTGVNFLENVTDNLRVISNIIYSFK